MNPLNEILALEDSLSGICHQLGVTITAAGSKENTPEEDMQWTLLHIQNQVEEVEEQLDGVKETLIKILPEGRQY